MLLRHSRKPGEANKTLIQDSLSSYMKRSLLMSFPQLKTHKLLTTTLNTFLLSYANLTQKIHLPGSAVAFCLYNGRFWGAQCSFWHNTRDARETRGERKKKWMPADILLFALFLANVNSYSNSYNMMYIFVITSGTKAEGSIFLKFLSYSRIQITKEEQRKCVEALVANKYVSLK